MGIGDWIFGPWSEEKCQRELGKLVYRWKDLANLKVVNPKNILNYSAEQSQLDKKIEKLKSYMKKHGYRVPSEK